MVVDQVDIAGLTAFETEDDAPVARYRDAPLPAPLTLELMEAVAGQVQVSRPCSRVKVIEHNLDTANLGRRVRESAQDLDAETSES